MNRNKIIGAVLATFFLLLLILWMAGFFATEIDPSLRSSMLTPVDEAHRYTVTPTRLAVSESVPGTTVARDETVISSRLLARIRQVHVRAGDIVIRGQTLIELEKEDLVARANQAKDQIRAIAAQKEDAELKLKRIRELAEQKMAASADVDAASANFNEVSARLNQAGQALKEAQVVMGYSNIIAPLSGRIVERLAEPGDTVAPAQPLLLLYDPLSIRVEAPVRESRALLLELGQEITTDIDATGQTITGRIEEIVPAVDRASRSFLVKATLDYNPGLMSGMFARLHIPATAINVLAIPESFVTEVGELNLVYHYTDGKIERRYVRLGQRYEDQVVVISGLEVGEVIVDPSVIP